MQRLNIRQFQRDTVYDGNAQTFTTAKPWVFPAQTTVAGYNVGDEFEYLEEGLVQAGATTVALGLVVTGNTNRMNTIIDSGDTLDTISELKAAWEAGDSTLTTAIASLTTTASTDRALIRTEHATDKASTITMFGNADTALYNTFTAADTAAATANATARSAVSAAFAAADSALQVDIDATEAAITTLETTVNSTHAALHTAHTAAIASLTTTASTDRALIRTEHATDKTATITMFGNADTALLNTFTAADAAAATANATARSVVSAAFAAGDAALQADLDVAEAAITTLEGTVNNTHGDLHTAHTAAIALRATAHEPTFSGDITVNSNKLVGHSGTEIRFNQTNLQLNTHSSGTLTGTAFGNIAVGMHPKTNQMYDFGTSGKRWREVYTKDLDFTGTFFKNGTAFAKGDIALGNVNNTADSDKPISTAAATKHTSQDTTIAVNTAKVGFTQALVDTTPSVVANTAKVSFDSTQVTENKDDITTNATAIALNTAKVTYDDTQATLNKNDIADNVTDIAGLDSVVNTTHANLHTSHATSLATKVNSAGGAHTGNTTFDGSTLAIDSSNSRVGVGTSSPSHMLHIHDAAGNADFRISRDLSDNHITINSHSFTKIGNGTGNTPFKWRLVTTDPFVWETSNTEWMRLDPNGNLGLGTTSPAYKLDVNGTARISGTQLFLPNLPTSDPLVAGQIWKNAANKLVVSQG